MNYETLDSGVREEYDSGMVRDSQEDKPRYNLIYEPLLTEWADLMTRGAQKYGANNWQLADSQEELDRFKESAFRHMIQYLKGDTDEAHAAAVCFNLGAIMMLRTKLEGE